EARDLMLSVRGDGSARSQQTRLGKALAAKRDRVFNGLTVKQSGWQRAAPDAKWALPRRILGPPWPLSAAGGLVAQSL
ncbi:MAG TPA: hypothetical protein VII95_20905, partial [Terriglobales bacterium]